MSYVPADTIIRYAQSAVMLDTGDVLVMYNTPDDARWARVAQGVATPDELRQTWIEWLDSHNPGEGDSFDA